MKKIFFKLNILISLFAVIGCPESGAEFDSPEEGKCPTPHWENWKEPEFISIFNDSLAIYSTYKNKFEYKKDFFLLDGDRCVPNEIERKFRLWFANYKVKQKPLLVDSLIVNNSSRIIPGYFKDSSVLLIKDYDITREFGFWKIGKNSIAFKEMSGDISVDDANLWKDSNILLKYYYLKLGVLDTKTGKIESLDTTLEQNKWLSSCHDMSYINGKVLCFRFNRNEYFNELIVDGIVTDTIDSYNAAYFYGNYVMQNYHDVSNYFSSKRIFKIDTVNFKLEEIPKYIDYIDTKFDKVPSYNDGYFKDDFK